jgi:uncharacterized protein
VALLPRGIAPALEHAISSFAVVVLEGGRAVGKSTLCRTVIDRNDWAELVDLSNPGVAEAIRLDPLRFLQDLPTPAFIDEAQLLPELPIWVKQVIDQRGGSPSQFVLTGSARLGRDQLGGSDPLAGRSVRLRMWSLTPSEQSGQPVAIATALFSDEFSQPLGPGTRPRSNPNVGTHVKGQQAVPEWDVRSWVRGGLPGIPGVIRPANSDQWNQAISSYVESVIPLGAGSTRVDHSRLTRTFRYLAANPAQQLNVARMANELQYRADTVRSYIDALEAAFLLFRLEAHRPSEHKVLTAHPRLHVSDLGLAAWAGRLSTTEPHAAALGGLLENQVALALAASTAWTSQPIALRHWRDQRAKQEVDLLLVHDDGRCIPIEVKSSISVGPADTVGLQAFAAANREVFVRGIVAYCGTRTIDLTPVHLPSRSILAVPISELLGGV